MYIGVTPSPDPAFVKELKRYDRYLYVEFDRELERFVIRRETAIKPHPKLWIVRDSISGGFRQPDKRDLDVLVAGDLWRGGGVKARILQGERAMEDARRKQERHVREELDHATRDNKLQLAGAYHRAFNLGKWGGAFRRIEPKTRGVSVKQIRKDRSSQTEKEKKP